MIDEGGRLEFLPLEPAPPPYAVNPSYHQTPSAPGQQSLQQTTTFQPDIARMPSTSMPLPYQQPTQGQSINQPMSTVDQRLGTAKQQPTIHTNTIVVTTQAASRTVIIEKKPKMQHWLHCLITLLFPPWLCVWIILCIMNSRKKDKKVEY